MADDPLVTLATFANPFEAEMMKNLLADEGIPSMITGEVSGSLFAGMNNLMGDIRLQVAESNLQRAIHLLDEAPEDGIDPEGEGPSTAIQVGDAVHGLKTKPEAAADSPIQQQTFSALSEREQIIETNLVRPERRLGPEQGLEEQPIQIAYDSEYYASRAWRAAVLGVVFWPVALYSLWLLIKLASAKEDLSTAGMGRLYGAMVIDLAVLSAVGLLGFLVPHY